MSLVKIAACRPNVESLASAKRLVEVVVRGDGDDRPEDLFRAHLHVGRRVGDDRRPQHAVVVECAAGEHLGAAGFGLATHDDHPVALALGDERRNIGCFIERIADDQRR